MKKFTFTIAALLCFSFYVTAQKSRIGFTGGHALSHFNWKTDPIVYEPGITIEGSKVKSRLKPGFTTGIVWDIPVNKNFSIHSGLNFVQKGGTAEDYDESADDERLQLTLNFFELPVNAVYYTNGIKGHYFFGAGISTAIAISGKYKERYDDEEDKSDLDFGADEEDDLKLFDFGMNFLAGYEFRNNFLVAINYNLGLANLSNQPGKFNTGYFGIKVGYMLKAR